jgi:hypothetical protein
MLGEVITLTAGRQNEFIWCQEAHIQLAAKPIMDVKTGWILTKELLELAFRLPEFAHKWLQNSALQKLLATVYNTG